jgi:hypothetical protein
LWHLTKGQSILKRESQKCPLSPASRRPIFISKFLPTDHFTTIPNSQQRPNMSSTWYVDYNNGSDSNNGTSFDQRVRTLTKAASLATAGDTVHVMGTASPNSGKDDSASVALSPSLTQLLHADDGRTGSIDVTPGYYATTSSSSPNQGSNNLSTTDSSTSYTQRAKLQPQPAAKAQREIRSRSRRHWRLINSSPPKLDPNAIRVEYWLDTKKQRTCMPLFSRSDANRVVVVSDDDSATIQTPDSCQELPSSGAVLIIQTLCQHPISATSLQLSREGSPWLSGLSTIMAVQTVTQASPSRKD